MTTLPAQIGPYDVESELGRGGMGVVYLATDSRLDRKVAIKALPEFFKDDPERLARFEREAKTLAALNHPNVAGIHGVEEDNGARYLVMEFVDGETLADALDRGPLAVDDALHICIQVAAGLEAAHEAGVIHRDLKPANIKVTPDGQAKVLDFGLARTEEVSSSGSSVSQLPTLTTPHSPTTPGAILGTAPYMSPEQARGRRVDKRSDIWSFGVVLYECLTGASPFVGETATDSIGAILHKDVNLALLPPGTPRAVRHVIERCIERDRGERLRDIGDARIEIERARRAPSTDEAAPSAKQGVNIGLVALVAVVFAMVGALAGVYFTKPIPEAKPVIRATIQPAPDTTIVHVGDVAGPAIISPDGTTIAYVARNDNGARHMWIRRLDREDPEMLRSTSGASHPFWSADGSALGFFTEGQLKRVDLATRSARTLAEARAGRGGAWLDDGVIIYAPEFQSAIYRIPATGGEPTQVTEVDLERHSSHRWPTPLPGGKFLYVAVNHDPGMLDEAAIFIGSADGGEPTEVMNSHFGAEVVGDTLLHVRDGVLSAQTIDIDTGAVSGDVTPVVTQVVADLSTWRANFSASDAGALVYHRFNVDDDSALIVAADADRIRGINRDGRPTATIAEGVAQTGVSLSPDGSMVAISAAVEGGDSGYDIWLYPVPQVDTPLDAMERTQTRLTFMPGAEVSAIWSPDGTEIAFGRIYGPPPLGIFKKRIGGGREELLLEADAASDEPAKPAGAFAITGADQDIYPMDWTADGRFILFGKGSWTGGVLTNVWALPLDGSEPFPVIESSQDVAFAEVSPNSRWIAFDATFGESSEVYVEPFRPGWEDFEGDPPPEGARWRISLAGGGVPRWSPDGIELYYVTNEGTMVAVGVDTEQATFVHDSGTPLFQAEFEAGIDYDVEARGVNGDRFFINGVTQSGDTSVNLVLNWRELLDR